MKGHIEVTFLFINLQLRSYFSQTLVNSKFVKSSIIVDNPGVVIDPKFIFAVKDKSECSLFCNRDFSCRKYMLTTHRITGENLCYGYTDGEKCVALQEQVINTDSVCYRKLKQSHNGVCVSPVGYYGPNCEHTIRDCLEGKQRNLKGITLSYIKPSNHVTEVLCDFENGYTNTQVRRENSVEVNFTRTYEEYENGFGNTHSEYWLGLKNMIDLTNNGIAYHLEIMITRIGLPECGLKYKNFRVLTSYNVVYSSFLFGCPAPPSLVYLSYTNFSTYDNHRNNYSPVCARPTQGGWWFRDTTEDSYCTFSNLNNPRGLLTWYSVQVSRVVMRLEPNQP